MTQLPDDFAGPLDISTEAYRTYFYSDGSSFRIERPATLFVKRDDQGETHRVVDSEGVTHRPTRGWIGLAWKPESGEPAFVA